MKISEHSSQTHRPEKARYQVFRDGNDVVVSSQFWQVRHSAAHGGNISSVVFPHGSGENIFAAPFSTQMQRGLPYQYPLCDNTRDTKPELSFSLENDSVHVQSISRLFAEDGTGFPAACTHTFIYQPWGLIRQNVTLDFSEPVPDIWKIVIARPVISTRLNEFTYRPSIDAANSWNLGCKIQPWEKMGEGESVRDACAVQSGDIPLYMMFLQRGVEGFDWCCGENLDQWSRCISDRPHVGKFSVGYNAGLGGNEVCIYPLDMWNGSLAMQGEYEFDFFMGLPFIREHVRPMLRTGGYMNVLGPERREKPQKVFIDHEEAVDMGNRHIQLVRHHDDSPQPEGIYWRDVSYPPYPSEIMKNMDERLEDLHAHGVRSTPYFSLHEINPETPGYDDVAGTCRRTADEKGTILHNYASDLGIWGSQMCLLSDWSDIVKRSIDKVLEHHNYDGLYFDWTQSLPCLNRGHRDYRHWDIEGFIDVIEWSRERVGEDGILYLHMSLEPFIMAENLATCVLVYESQGPEEPTSDMFPPIAEFMKTCSHVVLSKGCMKKHPAAFMLHSLLNHVTTDNPSEDFLQAYDILEKIEFTKYTSFANELVSPVQVSHPEVRSALYWNEEEALILLANLSERDAEFTWNIETRDIGWEGDGYSIAKNMINKLESQSFEYVEISRNTGVII